MLCIEMVWHLKSFSCYAVLCVALLIIILVLFETCNYSELRLMGSNIKGLMSSTEYFVIPWSVNISMQQHTADSLDAVFGSQHKALSWDSVHFSHCRRTHCQCYHDTGLKKNQTSWKVGPCGYVLCRYKLTWHEGWNHVCCWKQIGSDHSDSVAVLCL